MKYLRKFNEHLKIDMESLDDALSKVDMDMLEKLEKGEEISLNNNFYLYRYLDEMDIYVIRDNKEEYLQVMIDPSGETSSSKIFFEDIYGLDI